MFWDRRLDDVSSVSIGGGSDAVFWFVGTHVRGRVLGPEAYYATPVFSVLVARPMQWDGPYGVSGPSAR